MTMEELQPRSHALRNSLGKPKERESSDRMLTVADACDRLQVSKWTLYRLIGTGKLASVKIGRRRLISQRAMDRFMSQLDEEAEA